MINLLKNVENEEQTDGGLQCLLAIIKYFKINTSTINLNKAVENNYPIASNESLIKMASKYGLIAEVCDNIDISSIMNYNQPIILEVTVTKNKKHFVICYNYVQKEQSFLIWDPRYGFYYATLNGLKTLQANNKSIRFSLS